MTREQMLERFNELVIKECVGTITKDERSKLDRYQILRRPQRSREEIAIEEKARYETNKLLKRLRRAIYLETWM